MAGELYKFRRLKWGDPDQKLQMMPASPKPGGNGMSWFDVTLVGVIVISLGTIAWHLM